MATTRSIGLMSGTSGDGVDALFLAFDDVATPHVPRVLGRASVAFSAELQAELVAPHALTLARLTELHFLLPKLYAEAVRKLPNWQTADCVGMHGQTVAHQVAAPPPALRGTLQIGSSAALAAELDLPVVGDIRAADVALGGQGAPLVPFCHWFFCASGRGEGGQTLVVNFGGICNLTLVARELAQVQGFDAGPGMMLSDAFAQKASGGTLGYDRDGTLSRGGKRLDGLYAAILGHPFVAQPPPKSCGREEFGHGFAEQLWQRFAAANSADVAYTLLDATIGALVAAVAQLPGGPGAPDRVILAGGGALNPTLRSLAEGAFAPAQVEVRTEGVLAPQNHEPAAMALIAARTFHGLPSGLPQVTGARYAAVLGHVHPPPRGRRSAT